MKDPVALITGGCRGIGLGIAQKMAQAGFNLALTGRRQPSEVSEPLAALRAAARKQGKTIAYFQSELADTSAHASLVAEVEKHLGQSQRSCSMRALRSPGAAICSILPKMILIRCCGLICAAISSLPKGLRSACWRLPPRPCFAAFSSSLRLARS